ncbi:YceD family protein [Methylobacterium haplocladii]|uniref:Metal-binding protein n=1 Tax=Methylobacterium haplocladii TaxID=1176176 RepID=A0A512IM40_9HYPH|nr:DUF177 domain-containing protein [Methylobacterium haplocladii]GEO98708.1 hypothetical protein MHA02_10960 [Methylobacterium haplocladii]GJD85795.1 hypothetical protein HPGCJGGD_3688 [Methylobacterium haplocladii]GLS57642.1 hypothetical protein GCM10007887_02980 [Methylobacterium haplocladii]
MTRTSPGPLSRLIRVDRLVGDRNGVTVEATPEECAALAADFGIPAVRDLVGRFRVAGTLARLEVTGTVEAVVTQVCTVTLEPFESAVSEEVEVAYSDGAASFGLDPEAVDLPDPIVNGRVDFGALTAEFLALGLDPFPRKPGTVFEPVTVGDEEGPFAVLRKAPANDG